MVLFLMGHRIPPMGLAFISPPVIVKGEWILHDLPFRVNACVRGPQAPSVVLTHIQIQMTSKPVLALK